MISPLQRGWPDLHGGLSCGILFWLDNMRVLWFKEWLIFDEEKLLGDEANISAKQYKTVSRSWLSGKNEQCGGQECAETQEGKRTKKVVCLTYGAVSEQPAFFLISCSISLCDGIILP